MWILSCIIPPAISPAFNPPAENYEEKINKKMTLLKREKTKRG